LAQAFAMLSLDHLRDIGLPIVRSSPTFWARLEESGNLRPFAYRLRLASVKDFQAKITKSPEGVVLISGGQLREFRLAGRSHWAYEGSVLELLQKAVSDLRYHTRPARPEEAAKLEELGQIFTREEVTVEVRDTAGCIGAEDIAAALPVALLPSFDLAGIEAYIRQAAVKNVIVMCGAGISTSAGIPDFRSPEGLYATLNQKYPMLNRPEDMFSLEYFNKDPWPFYDLCREMWPGNFRPTPCHVFIRLLQEKGLLLRCYSQNIDSMETLAGIHSEKLVLAHGNFDSAHVAGSGVEMSVVELKAAMKGSGRTQLLALRDKHGGFCKPSIVFFGEAMPSRFSLREEDFPKCDLLIVMGTSLKVPPFCNLLADVPLHVPRLLLNHDVVGAEGPSGPEGGFRFEDGCYRDVHHKASIDDACWELADRLGWSSEMKGLLQQL